MYGRGHAERQSADVHQPVLVQRGRPVVRSQVPAILRQHRAGGGGASQPNFNQHYQQRQRQQTLAPASAVLDAITDRN
jgi:hypothetical protein